MLRNAHFGDVNDLVGDFVSCALKQVADNIDDRAQRGVGGLRWVPALPCEESLHVFADNPLRLGEFGGTGELVYQLVTLIVRLLLAGVTEALAGEPRKDEADLALILLKDLVWHLLDIGLARSGVHEHHRIWKDRLVRLDCRIFEFVEGDYFVTGTFNAERITTGTTKETDGVLVVVCRRRWRWSRGL